MTEHDMKQLMKDAQHFHSGLKCVFVERVLLPFRKFSPEIWVMENASPRELDTIFFGLLKLGVNNRAEIAKHLGICIDEFIFVHLDILIREGYVDESAGKLTLTKQGKGFDAGSVLEERITKEKFSFVWGDMTSRIEPIVEFVKEAGEKVGEKVGEKIEHGEHPDEEYLTLVLAEHYNKLDKNIKFYDMATRDFKWKFPEEKKYAEYAALFYVKDGEDSLDLVDLRMHVRTHDAPVPFILCEKLSKQASREPWLGKFEEIYNKYIESK